MKTSFDKMYSKIKFRQFLRNFIIVYPAFTITFLLFYEVGFTGESFGGVFVQSFFISLAFGYWTHNIFHKSELLKKFTLLKTEFPETDENIFYLLLFSKLERSKYEDKPELAIRKMHQANFWFRIQHAELKPSQIQTFLQFIYP